jgi:hypothetical protein
MIETSRLAGTNIVINRVTGDLLPEEVEQAVARTLTEAQEAPIIWDVREARFEHYTYDDAKQVDSVLTDQYERMQGQRRAFLVRDELQRQLVVMIVGRIQAPFPWAVFDALDDATAWLAP